MKNSPKQNPMIRVSKVAEELDFSERKVWREIKEKRMPAHRFGNSTRVSRDDLDEYKRRYRD